MTEKLKVLSLFSGIGAFEEALDMIGVPNEIVGFSEIDKWAIESYSAIHGVSKELNLGDVSEIVEEDLPDADMVTYGFPCQDVSVAGRGAGISAGTRSGLLYEAERVIEHVKPKYAIAENVKNLIGKRYKEDFDELLERLDGYGYNNYWEVLNAKDYGVPQNRERVFIVSIRKDVDDGSYEFPEGFESGVRLKDLILDEVEDKYYIENKKMDKLITSFNGTELLSNKESTEVLNPLKDKTEYGWHFEQQVYDDEGITRAVKAGGGSGNIPKVVQPTVAVNEATKKGYDTATVGDSINVSFPNSETRRGRVGKGVAQTLETQNTQATLERDYRIRKLTPLETWRLMGFTDNDYWTARKALEKEFYNGGDRSNSQMYKQAGNSIVVDVLEGIFTNLLKGE